MPSGASFILTLVALCAFAANSLLCREALRGEAIDAVSFTAIRLMSGAGMLALLVWLGRREDRAAPFSGGSWISAFALFVYALAFSVSYLQLTAATGALVLFGAVQVTMIGWALTRGGRLAGLEWLGFLFALAGLVLLTMPGLRAPPVEGIALMILAGAAWGAYTVRGRGSTSPLSSTASNFLRTLPMVAGAVALALLMYGPPEVTTRGALLAGGSGALASGVGYAIWYRALRTLAPTRAAIVQLAVPVLAAFGGVVVLGEQLTQRMWISGLLILGGILLALKVRQVREA